ncbi:MAG TPA: bifunctional oligoribonuclease/PAP phosphatase NrnA [Clostridiaceae bacterium]|nr:bifunctional oligoribonuclease/PAP phosphatase NrnA [Clostridiaceae bacterium]
MVLNEIISLLKGKEKILILPHVSADGDAIGSSIALGLALEKMGKQVRIYFEEEIPDKYNFLPGQHLIEIYDEEKKEFEAEVAVAIDTGDENRLGKRRDVFNEAGVTVNIDHHNTNSMYADFNFVQPHCSAVGEIVYRIIKMMDLVIDYDISICLYVAISTDTGGFRYSNTTPETHRIISELIDIDIDVSEISRRIFETNSYKKIKLMGAAIDTLELLENGRIALHTITNEVMKAIGAKEEECDGLVNIGRSIEGVEVAILLRELENGEIRVNLRSNTYVDVSEIAGFFSGGGHIRAAGCTMEGDIESAKQKLIDKIVQKL